MLERKGYNILDSLERHRQRVARETFADDNLDAANIIRRAPMTLVEQLLPEIWELQRLKLAVLREIYAHASQRSEHKI